MRCVLGLVFIFAASSALEPEVRNENRYFCFHVSPDVDLVVTDAHLDWGKWIPNPPDYTEIASPQGKRVPANDKMLICSSGRQMSLTGTTGSVRLATSDGMSVKFWWTVPWAGSMDFGHEFNKDHFSVSDRNVGSQRMEYVVKKK